jgi:hypothetical protein
MRNFERRIKRVEEELNTGVEDGSAWWENYRKENPIAGQIDDEFVEKHKDDPDFVKECAQGKWSDKTINEYADYYIKRLGELREDPKYASMFQKRVDSGCDEKREDQPA